jgi:hypothetical protein
MDEIHSSSSNCLLKGVKIGAPIVATNLPGPILIGRQQTLCLAAVGPKPSCAGWLVSGGHNLRHRVKNRVCPSQRLSHALKGTDHEC